MCLMVFSLTQWGIELVTNGIHTSYIYGLMANNSLKNKNLKIQNAFQPAGITVEMLEDVLQQRWPVAGFNSSESDLNCKVLGHKMKTMS